MFEVKFRQQKKNKKGRKRLQPRHKIKNILFGICQGTLPMPPIYQ